MANGKDGASRLTFEITGLSGHVTYNKRVYSAVQNLKSVEIFKPSCESNCRAVYPNSINCSIVDMNHDSAKEATRRDR